MQDGKHDTRYATRSSTHASFISSVYSTGVLFSGFHPSVLCRRSLQQGLVMSRVRPSSTFKIRSGRETRPLRLLRSGGYQSHDASHFRAQRRMRFSCKQRTSSRGACSTCQTRAVRDQRNITTEAAATSACTTWQKTSRRSTHRLHCQV